MKMNLFDEQFFWIGLFVLIVSSLVACGYLIHLTNFWRRKELKELLVLILVISFVILKKLYPNADFMYLSVLALVSIMLPYLSTFLYKKGEKEYIEKNKKEWERKGYVERKVPLHNSKKRILYKIGTNESIEVDDHYRFIRNLC